MWIAGLILLAAVQAAILVDLNKKYNEAYETACALSDVVRLHLDSPYVHECGFDEAYYGYASDLDELCYQHIKKIDLNKYVWCY